MDQKSAVKQARQNTTASKRRAKPTKEGQSTTTTKTGQKTKPRDKAKALSKEDSSTMTPKTLIGLPPDVEVKSTSTLSKILTSQHNKISLNHAEIADETLKIFSKKGTKQTSFKQAWNMPTSATAAGAEQVKVPRKSTSSSTKSKAKRSTVTKTSTAAAAPAAKQTTTAKSTSSPVRSISISKPSTSTKKLTSAVTKSKEKQSTTSVIAKRTMLDKSVEVTPTPKSLLNQFIQELPPIDVPDHYQVICTRSKQKADEILESMISQESVFGLDMEWKPNMIKGGSENPTGLVQICGASKVLLIQVSQMKELPDGLIRFFEDKSIYKTGVNISGDGAKIYRDFNVKTDGLLELGALAESAREISPEMQKYKGRSLTALTGFFLGMRMTKGKVQLSNWNTSNLSSSQIKYASRDAYASYAIYHQLMHATKLEKAKLVPTHMSMNKSLQM